MSLPSVLEAHLPQCFVPGIWKPAQFLVLVIKPGNEQETMASVAEALPTIIPSGMTLDVWPLPPRHGSYPGCRASASRLKPLRARVPGGAFGGQVAPEPPAVGRGWEPGSI